MQRAVKSSPTDAVQGYFWGKNCSPCARATGQGNHFEFIPMVSMESQHSTGGPTCHDFPRFVIISEKSILEVGSRWRKSPTFWGFFGKKDPLGANFHKCFPKRHMRTQKHVFLCKFREIWPTGSRWNRALFNGQKSKNSARAPVVASARIAPKIWQGQLQAIYSEFPKFHPNPFTSGGVIAERVNIVQTSHTVFPILGEASASSPSNNIVQKVCRIRWLNDKLSSGKSHIKIWLVFWRHLLRQDVSNSKAVVPC